MTRRFDLILAVDWSARAKPSPARPVKDAIFVGQWHRGVALPPAYHRTRHAAMQAITATLNAALSAGERVFLGFDFAFGYPAGFAAELTGQADALAVWDWLEARMQDAPDNANNRFAVAAIANGAFPGLGPFWGRPAGLNAPTLPAKGSLRHGHGLPDRRAVEHRLRGAQSAFKLFTVGAVGSQSLTGLPHLARLRGRYQRALSVWPQETGWQLPTTPIVLAEIWPSLFPVDHRSDAIPDARQVRATVSAIAAFDGAGHTAALFGPPPGLDDPDRVAREEGWIFGADHHILSP